MDSRSRQKGFTTVELVIVMAVIAILATVLIPTFSNLITQAEEAAALQEASSILKSYFIDKANNTAAERDFCIHAKGYYFRVVDGQLQKDGDTTAPTETGTVIVSSIADKPYYVIEAIAESEKDPSNESSSESKPHDCYDTIRDDCRCDHPGCNKPIHNEVNSRSPYPCFFCGYISNP